MTKTGNIIGWDLQRYKWMWCSRSIRPSEWLRFLYHCLQSL